MTKRIVICLMAALYLLLPLSVQAAPLDTERACALTLEYTMDDVVFPNVEVAIYQVAEAYPDGTFALIAPYDNYPVSIHGITSQAEWRDVATTLAAYIAANDTEPTAIGHTDKAGQVRFENLTVGLYLVKGGHGKNEKGIYTFYDFMIYVPSPTEQGDYNYDLLAKPKCENYTPAEHYRVVKLWKDSGTALRPDYVVVDILKDGNPYATVTLNHQNGWTYEWSDTDAAQWQVAERDVPEGYQVAVTDHETVFTITNTNPDAPPPPPDTGDSFPLTTWVMVCGLVGVVLVLFGVWGRKYEKDK